MAIGMRVTGTKVKRMVTESFSTAMEFGIWAISSMDSRMAAALLLFLTKRDLRGIGRISVPKDSER